MARAIRGIDPNYLLMLLGPKRRVDVERLSRDELRVYLKRRLRYLDAKILLLVQRLNKDLAEGSAPLIRSMRKPDDRIRGVLNLDYLMTSRNVLWEILEVLSCRWRHF